MGQLGERRPGRDWDEEQYATRFEESEARRERVMTSYYAGVPAYKIAAREGCSRENIGYIVRKFCTSIKDMQPLPRDQSEWLTREAKKTKCSAVSMARAILIDAITDLMEMEANEHGKELARDAGPRDAEHGTERSDPVNRSSEVRPG